MMQSRNFLKKKYIYHFLTKIEILNGHQKLIPKMDSTVYSANELEGESLLLHWKKIGRKGMSSLCILGMLIQTRATSVPLTLVEDSQTPHSHDTYICVHLEEWPLEILSYEYLIKKFSCCYLAIETL